MKNIFLLALLAVTVQLYAYEPDIYQNKIFDDDIASARIYRQGWELSYPIATLGDENQLLLSFDDLSSEQRAFTYTIIHCTEDWHKSRLSAIEYLDGYEENPIDDYARSFNTRIPYTHYELPIPNADINLKVSGNYALVVYDDMDKSQPVFTLRFYITENILPIEAGSRPAMQAQYRYTHQQLNLEVLTQNLNIVSPAQNLQLYIYQNGWEGYHISKPKIQFMQPDVITYSHPDALLIEGGNEYRTFNTRSLRNNSARVEYIENGRDSYEFYLLPEQSHADANYIYEQDFNGRYSIDAEKVNDVRTEGDYVQVHFRYQVPDVLDEELYIWGDFTHYQNNARYKMHYNVAKSQYECSLLLKQGVYNYKYALWDKQTKSWQLLDTEGSYADTENEYIIMVYGKRVQDRYMGLWGVMVVGD